MKEKKRKKKEKREKREREEREKCKEDGRETIEYKTSISF